MCLSPHSRTESREYHLWIKRNKKSPWLWTSWQHGDTDIFLTLSFSTHFYVIFKGNSWSLQRCPCSWSLSIWSLLCLLTVFTFHNPIVSWPKLFSFIAIANPQEEKLANDQNVSGNLFRLLKFENLCSRQGWLPGPQDEILANIQVIWDSLQKNILQVKNFS